jgi:hypothetical protein
MNNKVHAEEIELTDAQLEAVSGGLTTGTAVAPSGSIITASSVTLPAGTVITLSNSEQFSVGEDNNKNVTITLSQ